MNVVYNSTQYAIVAYPARQAFELVDKTGKRTLFVQGSVALGLRDASDCIPLMAHGYNRGFTAIAVRRT